MTRVVDDITAAGGTADGMVVDVSSPSDVEGMVAYAVSRWGRLDYAVNNAAVTPDRRQIIDLDLDEFDRVIAVNLRSVAVCLKHEIRQMRAQGGPGSIVNIASIRAHRALAGSAAYTAAKHAVLGLTRTAALESAGHGVRVNSVSPGGIETPMLTVAREMRGESAHAMAERLSPMCRLGDPYEVAHTSLWLCSPQSSYVTGQDVIVDGGSLIR